MKILLDPQIFQQQQYGGISRYYTALFSRLSKNRNLKIIKPFYCTANIYYQRSTLVNFRQKMYSFYLRILIKLRKRYVENTIVRNENYLKKSLIQKKYDLFIPTYYNPYFVEYIGEKPFVLTVYDMIHELFPEYYQNDSLNVVENKRYLIEKATKIIAVSYNTKKDILHFYPHIEESKIEVVYHGSSIQLDSVKGVNLPDNYILYVGSRAGYKNFNFFVEAIANLLKNNEELFLICAGGGIFTSNEIELIDRLGLSKLVHQRNFNDEDLGIYYKKAKCFVFPSLYEGFGIPVLEAMQSGCPVVLGNHSSFPEVAGDAGVYYETNDAKDLSEKIERLLVDEQWRKEFSLKGLDQVKKFSWEKAALECYTIYEMVCKQVVEIK